VAIRQASPKLPARPSNAIPSLPHAPLWTSSRLCIPPRMLRDLIAFLRTRDYTTAPKQDGDANGGDEKVVK